MSDTPSSNASPAASTPTSPDAPATSDSSATCIELQREVFNLKLVLLVVVLALTAFFWREAGVYKYQVAQLTPQAAQANQLLEALAKQKTSIPQINVQIQKIVQALGTYGESHPDYAQILAKYGLVVQPAVSTTSAAKPAATNPASGKK